MVISSIKHYTKFTLQPVTPLEQTHKIFLTWFSCGRSDYWLWKTIYVDKGY